jgi:hypothetical protein
MLKTDPCAVTENQAELMTCLDELLKEIKDLRFFVRELCHAVERLEKRAGSRPQ